MALKKVWVRAHFDPHTGRKWESGRQDPRRIAATGDDLGPHDILCQKVLELVVMSSPNSNKNHPNF